MAVDFVQKSVEKELLPPLVNNPVLQAMAVHIATYNLGDNNPYHNTKHMREMTAVALMLYRSDSHERNPMAMVDELIILVAGLWHDFSHTGGIQADAVNIQIACDSMETWVRQLWSEIVPMIYSSTNEMVYQENMMAVFIEAARDAIRVTEYPFVRTPTTLVQKCLRDADLLYTYSDDTGRIIHGLYLELKQAGKLPEGMTFPDFLKGQSTFLNGCEFFTPTGKAFHELHVDEILELQWKYARDQGFI
jgi:hypothetical protein